MPELKTYEADCPECGSTLEIDEIELANEIECPECQCLMDGTVADGVLTLADVDEEDEEDFDDEDTFEEDDEDEEDDE